MVKRDLLGTHSSDIVWYNPADHRVGLWSFQNGQPQWTYIEKAPSYPTVAGVSGFSSDAAGVYVLGVGDFSGDGTPDLFWGGGQFFGYSFKWVGGYYQQFAGYWNLTAGAYQNWATLSQNYYNNLTYYTGYYNPPDYGWVAYNYKDANNVTQTSWMKGVYDKYIYADGADFNHDGRSDFIVEYHVYGTSNNLFNVELTQAGGGGVTNGPSWTVDSAWSIAALDDFTGDGATDILWRNSSTGEVGLYTMQNGDYAGWTSLGSASSEWQVAGTGDFNGDGKADVLWRNATTNDYGFWNAMNWGSGIAESWQAIGNVAPEWQVHGSGDYYGDGSSDILWRSSTTGELVIWNFAGGALAWGVSVGTVSNDWQIG